MASYKETIQTKLQRRQLKINLLLKDTTFDEVYFNYDKVQCIKLIDFINNVPIKYVFHNKLEYLNQLQPLIKQIHTNCNLAIDFYFTNKSRTRFLSKTDPILPLKDYGFQITWFTVTIPNKDLPP